MDVYRVRGDLRMQDVDGGAVGGVEHHADHRRLCRAAQGDDVVESAGAAQIMHAGDFADGGQIPHLGEKSQRLVGIGKAEIDAA